MIGRCGIAVLAALIGMTAVAADEAEIMAHYDAYGAAFTEGRFADAEISADAAWRAAEEEWGGSREETAVLALNLARVRLMLDRRAEAVEPALRLKELVDAGAGTAVVSPEEAAQLVALAQFPVDRPSNAELDALEAALTAYAPTDFAGKRVSAGGWFYLLNGRLDRRQWSKTYEAADRATASMAGDADIPPDLFGTLVLFGVRAAAAQRNYSDATILGYRGIAAFPPQPPERPIDPVLGNLLGWDAGLHNALNQFGEALNEEEHPAPVWDEGRYPTIMGCDVEWLERTPPRYPSAGLNQGQIMAVMFEYYLDADGAVIRVDPVGDIEDDSGFAAAAVEALGQWRASPQPRAECRGPWVAVLDFTIAY